MPAPASVLPPPVALLDGLTKGMPGYLGSLAPTEIGSQGWNLLREDLNLPVAVLRQSALAHNARWMQAFVALHDGWFSPHGKTTMSPALFSQQLNDGAWAITLANAHQVQVARRFGIQRIFLANQLVGRQAIDYVLSALRSDPDFDFYCVVDACEHVRLLAEAVARANIGRPLQVLVEIGIPGARSGCRSTEEALAVARAIHDNAPFLSLRGVEGFEGIISHPEPGELALRVKAFLSRMREVAEQCGAEDLYGNGTVLLSAGGSAFYDLVLDELGRTRLRRDKAVLTRSGCYLTHDVKKYDLAYRHLAARAGDRATGPDGPRAALEVWAYVHARPEPGRVIVGMGKRDVSYDDPPLAQRWYRPAAPGFFRPLPLCSDHQVVRLDDQHAYLNVPESSPLKIGDMVQFGISHPCLTFDKWRAICLVDDEYNITGAITTYF